MSDHHYDQEEIQLIFSEYMALDSEKRRWMDFTWDRVHPKFFSDAKTRHVFRGQNDVGHSFDIPFSNGSTSLRQAKWFADAYFHERDVFNDTGRKVAVYKLTSHAGIICLRKVFGATKSQAEESEVIIRDAVWRRYDAWTCGSRL